MLGRRDPQATMLGFVDLEDRVPNDHPHRTIKTVADEAPDRLSPEFDRMYSKVGRASVPRCSGRLEATNGADLWVPRLPGRAGRGPEPTGRQPVAHAADFVRVRLPPGGACRSREHCPAVDW